MKITNTAKRLRIIMNIKELTVTDLSRLTHLPKSSITEYMNGKHLPNQRKLTILAETLGVSETWLLGYDVEMKREIIYDKQDYDEKIQGVISKDEILSIIENCDKETIDFLTTFLRLSSEQKSKVVEIFNLIKELDI